MYLHLAFENSVVHLLGLLIVTSVCLRCRLSYRSVGHLLGWLPAERPGTKEEIRVTHSNYAFHSAFIDCKFTQSRTSTYINVLLTL